MSLSYTQMEILMSEVQDDIEAMGHTADPQDAQVFAMRSIAKSLQVLTSCAFRELMNE